MNEMYLSFDYKTLVVGFYSIVPCLLTVKFVYKFL